MKQKIVLLNLIVVFLISSGVYAVCPDTSKFPLIDCPAECEELRGKPIDEWIYHVSWEFEEGGGGSGEFTESSFPFACPQEDDEEGVTIINKPHWCSEGGITYSRVEECFCWKCPTVIPEFSTYGLIIAIVFIGIIVFYIIKRKKK
ncbi:hypothetical protein KY331_02895 [Candidatus Woesearchaeota archaeon]|nr:hypothetical protein [Candidatus Woesearchaeota archaeon]